jgi:hypothetical protein
MIAYKLFKIKKDGSIHSLFINNKVSLKLNKWMNSRCYKTKGFAVRPGWHSTATPVAPHLSIKGRAWYIVEIDKYKEIQRPINQGGLWYLSKKLRILKKI